VGRGGYAIAMDSDAFSNATWLIDSIAATLGKASADEEGVAETLSRLGQQSIAESAFVRPEPQKLAACRHLPELTATSMLPAPSVAAALAACDDDLRWVQNEGYGNDAILEDYAHCELIGPEGFFPGDDFLLGLIIVGPERIYRDHFHKAPELYWLLTGPTDWSHASGPYRAFEAGDTIWHPPHYIHATRTLHAPLLAVWAWTRDVDGPARFVSPPP
jgi:hypothetical protein